MRRPHPRLGGATVEVGGCESLIVPARGQEYNPRAGLPASDLVLTVWYPDQDRVGLDPAPLMALFDDYPVAYHRRGVRLQANYDYYARIGAFELIAESAPERAILKGLLDACLAKYGGRAVIYATVEDGGKGWRGR